MSRRRFRFTVKVKDVEGNVLKRVKICEAQELVDTRKAEVLSTDTYGRIRSVQLGTAKPLVVLNNINSSISSRESLMNALCVGRHVDSLSPSEEAARGKVQVWQEIHDMRAPLLIAKIGGEVCGAECEQ